MDNDVILVNRYDEELGTMNKLQAHELGMLHRAFSIFVFNSNGELLLQRRALTKYHSPGLWTNSCCSHPAPGESNLNAANRRLKMEMGMESELNYKFKFHYKSEYENGLTEHEIDHVFFGASDLQPLLNTDEVCDWSYMNIDVLCQDIINNPQLYTTWFKKCLPRVISIFKSEYSSLTLYKNIG